MLNAQLIQNRYPYQYYEPYHTKTDHTAYAKIQNSLRVDTA